MLLALVPLRNIGKSEFQIYGTLIWTQILLTRILNTMLTYCQPLSTRPEKGAQRQEPPKWDMTDMTRIQLELDNTILFVGEGGGRTTTPNPKPSEP